MKAASTADAGAEPEISWFGKGFRIAGPMIEGLTISRDSPRCSRWNHLNKIRSVKCLA